MKELQLLRKSALLAVIGYSLSKLIGYLYRIVLARMGPEQYGVFSMATSIILLCAVIAKLGLDYGIQMYVPLMRAKKGGQSGGRVASTALWLALAASAAMAALLCLLSGPIGEAFHSVLLGETLRALSPAVPITALTLVCLAGVKSLKKAWDAVFLENIADNVPLLALSAALIYLGYGLGGAVAAYVAAGAFTLTATYLTFRKGIAGLPGRGLFMGRELLAYSVPLMFSGIMYMMLRWTDVLMVGYFMDAASAGIYDVAASVSQLLFIIPEAALYLFIPVMTEIRARGDAEGFRRTLSRVRTHIILLNAALAAAIIALSGPIVAVFFGAAYAPAAAPLAIIAAGCFLKGAFLPDLRTLAVLKETSDVLRVLSYSVALNVVLNLFLIPRFGLVGGAVATASSYALMGALSRHYCGRIIRAA